MVAHHKNLATVRPSIDCWGTRSFRPKSPRARGGHTPESYNEVLRLQKKIEEIHQPARRSHAATQHTNPGSRKLCAPLQWHAHSPSAPCHDAHGYWLDAKLGTAMYIDATLCAPSSHACGLPAQRRAA